MSNNTTSSKYDTKKVIRMVIFGSAITIFIMTLILSFNDFEGIMDVLKTTNVKYLMLALLLLLIYAILYPLTTVILTKAKKCDISYLNTYLIGSTEHFFNGITPFATGGQPFQVYAYTRLGVKPADSTGILMMNFIIFMLVTNFYALCSLFYYPQLSSNISNLTSMVVIGFSINFFVLIFLISVATTKKVREWLEKALLWFCRFKFLKKFIEPGIPKFNDYCYQAQNAFKELWRHKTAFASCFVIKFFTMGIYYAITFYILLALGVKVSHDQLFYIICGTAFAITMCVFVPTPGSSGGIEFAFKSIFQSIAVGVTAEVAMGGMLLWRLLSYYLMMLLSFFTYLILENITIKREKSIKNLLQFNRGMTPKTKKDSDNFIGSENVNETFDATDTENIEVKDDVEDKEECVDESENNVDIEATDTSLGELQDCLKSHNTETNESIEEHRFDTKIELIDNSDDNIKKTEKKKSGRKSTKR